MSLGHCCSVCKGKSSPWWTRVQGGQSQGSLEMSLLLLAVRDCLCYLCEIILLLFASTFSSFPLRIGFFFLSRKCQRRDQCCFFSYHHHWRCVHRFTRGGLWLCPEEELSINRAQLCCSGKNVLSCFNHTHTKKKLFKNNTAYAIWQSCCLYIAECLGVVNVNRWRSKCSIMPKVMSLT